ncbi:MAG TPA: cytochrome o ubiquinol oxidase subunit IV [Candidatus Saccharimonadales bacterium]|nr:cytochrome o ubiquinol oxidase subunit IV [Candidatus Saccharimonadales bacterium]
MNEELPKTKRQPKPRHGSTPSYVTGFVLSLIFTLIPYYLVTHESLKGHVLIAVILTFAFAQLLIQVLFFLHLGRERGPRFNTVFLAATFSAVCVVVGGSVWIMYHLQKNMPDMAMSQKLIDDESISQVSGVKTGGCDGTNVNHHVFIKNGVAFPYVVVAHLCDSLTFTNDDNTVRYIAFGSHPHHELYAGNMGQTLYSGRSWTITLSQAGKIKFHDHNHPQTTGIFVVNP